MGNKKLKITAGILSCLTVIAIGNYCYKTQAVNNIKNEVIATNEPIVITQVSSYDTRYNFADSDVLAQYSDLVVIGKVTDLESATNFNPTTKKYGKARTPGSLEVLEIIKSDGKIGSKIEFMDGGGTISYSDYEKSLLPAQKAKRDYLMNKNGTLSTSDMNNVYVKQISENQLEIEENKTYIMYLNYNEDFGKYMVVNQPYGVKEYNVNTGKILNHVTDTVESVEDLK